MAEGHIYQLRMRPLPKPEYRLMKSLIDQWQLKDESELFAVALRLLYEVNMYSNGQGQAWIRQVIDSYRSMPEAERAYDTAQG